MTRTLEPPAIDPAWSAGQDDPAPFDAVTVPIMEHALRRPQAIAVIQQDRTLRYAELVQRARRVAHALTTAGVQPGDRVGVAVGRSPDLVTAALATMLAGAVYLPLEVSAPHRLANMLADAGVDMVLVDGTTVAEFGAHPVDTVLIDTVLIDCVLIDDVLIDDVVGDPVPDVSRPDPVIGPVTDGGYLLYTSGSTGEPKGVQVSHRALSAFAWAFGRYAGYGTDSVAVAYSSTTFDVSMLDIFLPLVHGGTVAMVGEADRLEPALLQAFCEQHAVTHGFLPVALLPLLDPTRLPAWRVLLTGAEPPGPEQVARWTANPHRRFVNCYGPTEATVAVAAFEATGNWDRPLPIGSPLPNHHLEVRAADGTSCGVGDLGELFVGGPGLADGYLNRPAETAERFVTIDGRRMYRTGDLCRWNADGTLSIAGRIDRQVKIRGQRVELGEVEANLLAHPGVVQAVTDVRAGAISSDLVAYYSGTATSEELLAWCAQRLPPSMVPTALHHSPRLPLRSSGKYDLDLLAADFAVSRSPERGTPQDVALSTDPAVPANPAAGSVGEPDVRRVVTEQWCRVLGLPAAADGDNFYGSGGHSVAAMNLVAAIRSGTSRAVTIRDLFAAADLAALIAAVTASPAIGSELPTSSPAALSPAQRRLWFAFQLDPRSAANNLQLAWKLSGALDVDALTTALTAVETRHQVLRWQIDPATDEPMVTPPVRRRPEIIDLAPDVALSEKLDEEAGRPFDLTRDRWWRAVLLRSGPTEQVLVLTLHHLVFDGWSIVPLLADLQQAYGAAIGGTDNPILETSSVQHDFADYVAWRRATDEPRRDDDLAWWAEHLTAAPTVLELPTDRPRPAVAGHRGRTLSAELSPAGTELATRVAADASAAPAAVMLAGFAETIRRLTGIEDLLIGCPVADRRHPAFSETVGMFVEILPLRLRPRPAESFTDAIRATAAELIAAQSHPAATIDEIARVADTSRDPGRSTLVQVLFNIYNFDQPLLQLPGIAAVALDPGIPGTAFDLTIYLSRRTGDASDSGYQLEALFNPELFDDNTIRTLLDGYVALTEALLRSPNRPVGEAASPELDRRRTGTGSPQASAVASKRLGRVSAFVQPTTTTERAICAVWSRVLDIEEPGVTDNFFDVGGHTLALAGIRAAINSELAADLSIVDLFTYPTVRDIARHVDAAGARATARSTAGTGSGARDDRQTDADNAAAGAGDSGAVNRGAARRAVAARRGRAHRDAESRRRNQ
jgi:mycobactin peptide synthetase MbtE